MHRLSGEGIQSHSSSEAESRAKSSFSIHAILTDHIIIFTSFLKLFVLLCLFCQCEFDFYCLSGHSKVKNALFEGFHFSGNLASYRSLFSCDRKILCEGITALDGNILSHKKSSTEFCHAFRRTLVLSLGLSSHKLFYYEIITVTLSFGPYMRKFQLLLEIIKHFLLPSSCVGVPRMTTIDYQKN